MKWSMRAFAGSLFMLSFLTTTHAQEPLNPMVEAYIDMYRPLAIEEMKRTGIPAAIKIAQGILETDAGKSLLVRNSNNHFGIKCKSTWTGEKVYHDDDEKGECFRKYVSPEDSYRDHSDFLKYQPRYASLFQIDPMDYKSWAYGLKSAGYATNPKYPEILIRLIETYRLDDLTYYALHGRERGLGSDMASRESSEPQPIKTVSTKVSAAPASEPVERKAEAIVQAPAVTYPEGVFRSGGTKAVYARKGTSLLALAETHGVRLSKLLAYNDISVREEFLPEDRLIYLQRPRNRTDVNEQKKQRWEPFRSMTSISNLISRPRS
jgi:Mannosyl-glycoprotein endo-beta-N-acetylglucosaminidase